MFVLRRKVGLLRRIHVLKRLSLLSKQIVEFSEQGKTYPFLPKNSGKNILKLKNIRENSGKMVLEKCCEP